MKLEQRQRDGITLVDLAGRLDSSAAGEVTDQLNAIVKSGVTRLVLNLRELSYISSAGLRSILIPAKLIKSSGGELRLCEPAERVLKVLTESGFTNLILTDSHEDQSVAALSAR